MTTQRQTPDSALEFTLKLANAPNMGDREAIDAIFNQIKRVKDEGYFPEFFHMIDPDNYYSKTKLLDDSARTRLSEAIRLYGKWQTAQKD